MTKEYFVDSVLSVGKYKAQTIRDIYRFDPSYLNYIFEKWDDFYIDVTSIYSLPKPTPFVPVTIEELDDPLITEKVTITYGTNQIEGGKNFLSKGGIIQEQDYKFSDKAIANLQNNKANLK